jgi:hypothetical protein
MKPTRARWLHGLEARGIRVSLSADGRLRVRGGLSVADRRRLDADRAGVVRLLRRRRRDASVPDEAPAPVETRAVVGQQAVRGGDGRLSWRPVYADRPLLDTVSARYGLLERVAAAHAGGPWYGSYDVALLSLSLQAARLADRIAKETEAAQVSPSSDGWRAPRWPRRPKKSSYRA